MADISLIFPRELNPAATVSASEAIPIDNGVTVQKATPTQIVNAGRPFATQAQAETGTDATVAMSPLTTKQAIEAVVPAVVTPFVELAEAWAESQTPPNPGVPDSKSAKTWASESEASALDADGSAQRASDAADLTVEIAGNVMYLDTYEAESIAYFNRCVVPPSFALRSALDGMIKRLKAAGIWPKLDALWVLSAETKQAAYLNLVQDAYNLTEVNSAGITFVPSVGVRGNGVNAYLSTGFNPAAAVGAQFQRLSASLGIAPIDGEQFSGGSIGNFSSYISPRRSSDVADFMVNGTTGGSVIRRPSGLGFWVSTRTGSAGSTNLLYKDGVPLTQATVPGDAATALESTEIRLLGRGGSVNTVNGRGLSLAFIGGALSASDVGAFYDAVQ